MNRSAIGIFKKLKQLLGKHLLFTVCIILAQVSSGYGFADIVSLTASSSNYSDETVVRLHEQATLDFDGDWDAYKLSNAGNTPDFYTVINNTKYAINSVPPIVDPLTILLNFKAAFSGHYSISVNSLNESQDSMLIIILEDKLFNIRIVLEENTVYEFDASMNDPIDRFNLHYKKVSAIQEADVVIEPFSDHKSLEKVEFEINEHQTTIRFNNPQTEYATIQVVNTAGKVVYHKENINTQLVTSISLEEDSSRTMCIARIILGNEVLYKKLYF